MERLGRLRSAERRACAHFEARASHAPTAPQPTLNPDHEPEQALEPDPRVFAARSLAPSSKLALDPVDTRAHTVDLRPDPSPHTLAAHSPPHADTSLTTTRALPAGRHLAQPHPPPPRSTHPLPTHPARAARLVAVASAPFDSSEALEQLGLLLRAQRGEQPADLPEKRPPS